MEASYAGKGGYGDKGRWVKYWVSLGCWISPCYCPFSLGAHFETYEPFISLFFQFFFSGRGKPLITESADMGVWLYLFVVYRRTVSVAHSIQLRIILVNIAISNEAWWLLYVPSGLILTGLHFACTMPLCIPCDFHNIVAWPHSQYYTTAYSLIVVTWWPWYVDILPPLDCILSK